MKFYLCLSVCFVALLQSLGWTQTDAAKAGANSPAGDARPGSRCSPKYQSEEKKRIARIRKEVFDDPGNPEKFRSFLGTLPVLENELGTYFIVEGDLPMTEGELFDYVHEAGRKKSKDDPSFLSGSELVVNLYRKQRDFYKDVSKRTLRYAIDRKTFPTAEQFDLTRQNLSAAGAEWQSLCPDCQLKFVDVTDVKVRPRHTEVVNFIVRYERLPEGYVALGFYPHHSPMRRYLYVDPKYFTTDANKVGIMRHEMGHILGYRHEHEREEAPGDCYSDATGLSTLTEYDPLSVMHYFCGANASNDLAFTDNDRKGHVLLYGLAKP